MVTVRDYTAADAQAFRALNLAWIEAHFAVEESDLRQLDNPQGAILADGGRILIAELGGDAVGTVALVPAHGPGHGSETVELIKMAVRTDLRGHGIGRALMDAALLNARAMGGRQIWLETNSRLDAAVALYQRAGFRELTGSDMRPTPYSRCNCQMLLDL